MKPLTLILLSTALLFCSTVVADELDDQLAELDDLDDDDLADLDEDEALLREIEEKYNTADMDRENDNARLIAEKINAEFNAEIMEANEADGDITKMPRQIDPCRKIHCGAGRICQAEEKTASCVCIPDCPIEDDSRRRVCTNFNQTWPSDCEVYRQRCLCDKKDPACKDKQIKHIHIDYYGECRETQQCSTEEMEDFPRRMRDWLFNVMKDLADRRELSPHYIEMTHEAETNLTRRWSNAAIWKWCDLDGHPHDRSVSRHELFPIRAPLLSLEHCIAPFLESCDTDQNHRITLSEWGKCLELEDDTMEERCAEIKEKKRKEG